MPRPSARPGPVRPGKLDRCVGRWSERYLVHRSWKSARTPAELPSARQLQSHPSPRRCRRSNPLCRRVESDASSSARLSDLEPLIATMARSSSMERYSWRWEMYMSSPSNVATRTLRRWQAATAALAAEIKPPAHRPETCHRPRTPSV